MAKDDAIQRLKEKNKKENIAFQKLKKNAIEGTVFEELQQKSRYIKIQDKPIKLKPKKRKYARKGLSKAPIRLRKIRYRFPRERVPGPQEHILPKLKPTELKPTPQLMPPSESATDKARQITSAVGKGVTILRPNPYKIAAKNGVNLLIAIIVIGIMLGTLNWAIGLEFFVELADDLGINVSIPWLIGLIIFPVVVIEIIVLIFNFITEGITRFEIHSNKILIRRLVGLVYVHKQDIPFKKINLLTFNNAGMFNTMFNTGRILITLLGDDKKKIELEYLDDVEKKFETLMRAIRSYVFAKQKEYEIQLLSGNSYQIKKTN